MPTRIGTALADAARHLQPISPTARLDAELLLAYVLGCSRAHLLAELHSALPEAAAAAFAGLIARRIALEPVAYLIGRREFYGLEFVVDRRVLVPRPETELLVEHALALLPPGEPRVVADIGTGSGCIAVSLAVHRPAAHILAVDLSGAALEVAALNVARHGVAGRVQLLAGDLLTPLSAPVDMLVSNPPYTLLHDIDAGVRRHEPHLALDGGADGLAIYRRLLAAAPAVLRPHGAVLLEIGAWQAADVTRLARGHFPQASIQLFQDAAGHDRVMTILQA